MINKNKLQSVNRIHIEITLKDVLLSEKINSVRWFNYDMDDVIKIKEDNMTWYSDGHCITGVGSLPLLKHYFKLKYAPKKINDSQYIEYIIDIMKNISGIYQTSKNDKFHIENGILHRIDGPAVELNNGNIEYWIDGKKLSDEEVITILHNKELSELLNNQDKKKIMII